LNPRYNIRKFAELAGVTVKALHHYDRLGLLKPARTHSGYRVYCERDLEILEQIVALKFLGLPLKEIGAVLKRPAMKSQHTFQMQRRALEDRQEQLGRAIRAIQAAEEAIASGRSTDHALLKSIIEAIDMQDDISAMKKYYSKESWEQHRRYYEDGPSAEWRALYADARKMLNEDPACAEAQALVYRWYDLSRRAHSGDPDVQTDSIAAWMNRANWPDAMKQRAAELGMEEVLEFIKRAEMAPRKACFDEPTWTKLMELRNGPDSERAQQLRDRVQLFRDLEAALGENPAGPVAQELVRRRNSQLETICGGDPQIIDLMNKGWAQRRNWPESMRWRIEDIHQISYQRFEKAADFLDRAIAASQKQETKITGTQPSPLTPKTRLLEEFEEEMAATRNMLAAVPDDKFAWRPQEKAFTLGRLANHVSMMPGAVAVYLRRTGALPAEAPTRADLLDLFDRGVAACREQFEALTDERLAGNILVMPGVEKPVWKVLRGRGFMNHLIHHRGQLSVYLRILGATVPGMYGPSADEK